LAAFGTRQIHNATVAPQASGRARAIELLNLLENLCCAEFLLRYEDEAQCSRFDAAQTQKWVGGFQWDQLQRKLSAMVAQSLPGGSQIRIELN
jgi:hypothetical protein